MVRLAYQYLRFQSTLPLRGATLDICPEMAATEISIHAPLTGSDSWNAL